MVLTKVLETKISINTKRNYIVMKADYSTESQKLTMK